MSEYFVGSTGANNQTNFSSLDTSEVLDDLGLNTGDSPTFSGLFLEGSGSTIFSVDGSNGRLFGVTDEVTGTVFSVNDAAGLPIIEVESTSSYDKITLGEYGSDLLVLSGQNTIEITGSQIASQSWVGQQGYITSSTAANDATITLSGGTEITTTIGDFTTNQSSPETLTINHANVSRTNTTNSASPAFGSTFTVVDGVTSNARGHVTAENVKTITLPSLGTTSTTALAGNTTVNDVSETNLLNRLAALDSSDTIYIGDAGDDTTVVVRGTLQVDGSTTTINSNTLSIGDNQIVLNNDVTGTPTQNAGIIVERGSEDNASLIWDETSSEWKAGTVGNEIQIVLGNGTYSGLRAQSTTKGDVGLGNVTNESKATMFSGAALTGNSTATTQLTGDNSTRIATTAYVKGQNYISSVTASDVGLGNVTNESKATMFTSPSFTGDVVITDDTFPFIRSSTNGSDAGIRFSTASGSSYGQQGTLSFNHLDTQSYGSAASFKLATTEATLTILADGKLMYGEGIYSKPASGTGAGTRKDSNWDTAYTHTSATNNPHSVTKTQVGLGNVTNESKATMFSSPSLTGIVYITDANDVPLRVRSSDGASMIGISDSNSTNDYSNGIGVYGNALHLTTNGNERIRIDASGNVGIGTTSPSAKLDIHTATNTNGLLIREDTDDSITHNFYIDSSDNGVGVLYANGQSSKIQLNTAGNSYFNGGNVGIGTTSPQDKLDVAGIVNSSNTIVSNATYTMFSGRSNRTTNDYGGLNKQYFKLNLVTAGPNTTGESSAHGFADLRFQLANNSSTTSVADIMTLRSGGNVGIGTTTPENKLHILTSTTDTSSQLMVQNGSTGDAAIKFNISGQSYVIGIDNSDANKFKISGHASLGTYDRLTIDTSGNVAIANNATISGDLTVSTDFEAAAAVNFSALANAGSDVDKFLVSDSGDVKFRTGAEVLSDIGGQASISAPNAPASASAAIVGNTVEVTFAASTTLNIGAYLVYSSIDGSDYGLISIVPPDDFAASMSIIDNAFDETGTQAYRVYAMKYGILSSATTASVSYAVSSAEPTTMSVVNLNNAYYVQWNPPSSNARFVTAYNVYKHEHATQGSLSRSSASLIYSGMNTNYMYQISGTNNNNFHQFWVETTIA